MKSIKFLIALCLLGCNVDHTDSSKLSTTDYDLLETDDFSSPEIRTRLLKDYAVCSCIQTGYNNDKIFKSDNSISVLVDIANFSPEVYFRIDSFAKDYILKTPKSQIGDYGDMKPIIFNCTNLYQKESLDSLLRVVSKL